MRKLLLACMALIVLSGCMPTKDEARSFAFETILNSKLSKAEDDLTDKKITQGQMSEYKLLIEKLIKLESKVRAGYDQEN